VGLRFHPFGHRLQIQALGHGDNGTGQVGVICIGDGILDEGAIDLQNEPRQSFG